MKTLHLSQQVLVLVPVYVEEFELRAGGSALDDVEIVRGLCAHVGSALSRCAHYPPAVRRGQEVCAAGVAQLPHAGGGFVARVPQGGLMLVERVRVFACNAGGTGVALIFRVPS